MPPICITGMHRSGTSLVAQLLHACGLELGPEDEFFPPNEFNADGYWENSRFSELGDAVLEALGGGWDSPPRPPADWDAVEGIEPIRASVLQAIDDLGLTEPWGWKDPRAALALPFWIDLLPDLRVVVCVRHPLEVARSLHRRGASSPQLGLSLWQTYNERLLDTARDRRVVTHYAAYFRDARAELERVTRAVGLEVSADGLDEAASRVKGELRHHESGSTDPPLPRAVLELYDALCAEAEVVPEPRRRAHRTSRSVAPLAHELAADAWRSHMDSMRKNRDDWREAAERATAELAAAGAAAEALQRERDDLQARAAHLDDLTTRTQGLEDEIEELHGERETLREQRAELEVRVGELEAERRELAASVAAAEVELEQARRASKAIRADAERWRKRHGAMSEELAEREGALAATRAELAERKQELDLAGAVLAERTQELAAAAAARDAQAAEARRQREEAALLRADRDRWQERALAEAAQAAGWRESSERLAEAQERRLTARVRRAAARPVVFVRARLGPWWLRFRLALRRRWFPIARRVWWALPRRLRDFLRPILFKEARGRSAARTFVPPRIDRTPAVRPAGTGVNREIPRHRRTGEPVEVIKRALPPVSVLIPTLNGGALFARAIAQIVRQEGLEGLELVVVDSGSSDGTPDVARRAGARVIEIPQSEFGHGRTRNLAAESATNEILLMLVQDAVPLTRDVFRNLVRELVEDPRAAATWARQVPHIDADLYGAFVVYSHDRVLAEDRSRALDKRPERRTPEERRALAGLDDVCAALRRSAWEELRFADVGFAEDLDFGLRAIEAGWTIRHVATAAVAHSHTRDAAYHLRRAVADRLYVAERLGDERLSRAAGAGAASVAAAAVTLAEELEGALRRVPVDRDPGATLESALQALARALERKPQRLEPTGQLAQLVDALRRGNGQVEPDPPVGELREELLGLLSWPPLRDFGRAQLTPDPVALADLVAKLAASAFGRVLGDALRHSGEDARARELMAGV